ncbi:hypothetical protein [Desulfoglaeba alkanexedens]|uniref:Flagellar protein FliT n=1 Tax=Desulfoglaeba alkanexedens ALDC TaxID=980445 RepID=A0A4P8L1I9_9BACT|nr:hypothetical protein [Desulfoglaeba alkanexedens]QCQ21649.1 hypothetical protein FDQ92_05320 [Desulfoglaeba alkanexedens ALDC]
MLSQPHETLYRRLVEISAKIETALENDDAGALANLAGEHRAVMDALGRAGQPRDPGLLETVTSAHERVTSAIEAIRRRRDELGRQLGMRARKKRAISVYGSLDKIVKNHHST